MNAKKAGERGVSAKNIKKVTEVRSGLRRAKEFKLKNLC